ncbi:MAG TPA: imidazoleglycerol-phosphate dehydratase HisB [Firmicutes bacterium]|nr:imidazoleglycerol-phosphate dehydratase HisB [Bacillota bacterium]
MRTEKVTRKTKETDITAEINLDGRGSAEIDTGIGFFDHMLTAFAVHGGFDLKLRCRGDLEVDGHHSVEDIGIVLGKLLAGALGDKKGIARFACEYVPMDDALARSVLDISGRPYLVYNAGHLTGYIGTYDADLTEEFFRAVCSNAMITLHIDLLRGANTHHMCEAIFKSFGRALGAASRIVSDKVLSSKGSL